MKADRDAKKLTVVGNVDPFWLRERIESKTRKKVEMISYPQPKRATGSGSENMAEDKSEKKTEDNKGGEEQKLPKEVIALFNDLTQIFLDAWNVWRIIY